MTAAAPPLTTLPDAGRFIVNTEHSAYIIDMDARTFERWPAAPAANVLPSDGKPLSIIEISCTVGGPMRATYRNGDRIGPWATTPVVSITATP